MGRRPTTEEAPRQALERVTRSAAETERLAEELGVSLQGGEVVLLSGELGSGKTVFVRGLARGVGCDPDLVASPSFVLLTTYPGRLALHHADLYRLRGDGDEADLGLEELPGAGAVLAVEWADRLSAAPWESPVRVRLEHLRNSRRLVRIARGAG